MQFFFILMFLLVSYSINTTMTSLSNNNPFPLYQTSIIPYVSLKERLTFENSKEISTYKDNVFIGISFASQTAREGKRISGKLFPTSNDASSTSISPVSGYVPLGDLKGRTNLIALLGGTLPSGKTLPTILQKAADELSIHSTSFNETIIDPLEQLGCNSTDFTYGKKSILFSLEHLWGYGFGGSLNAEIGTVKQTINQVVNYTTNATLSSGTIDSTNVNTSLMNQFNTIVESLNQTLTRPTKTSAGEIRLGVFWRDYFEINEPKSSWPQLLLFPFAHLQMSISPDKVPASVIFKSPLGNNGHYAIGGSGGITFDFVDTIFLTTQGGYSYFFKRDIEAMPLPNNLYQTNLYPFSTDVSYQPGGSWYFSGKVGSRHFIDKCSVTFEYVMVDHAKDTITLKNPDAAFIPSRLEDTTTFKSKFFNLALTYDIAPTISFGFTWQNPISNRNSYRSTTLLFSVNGLL